MTKDTKSLHKSVCEEMYLTYVRVRGMEVLGKGLHI